MWFPRSLRGLSPSSKTEKNFLGGHRAFENRSGMMGCAVSYNCLVCHAYHNFWSLFTDTSTELWTDMHLVMGSSSFSPASKRVALSLLFGSYVMEQSLTGSPESSQSMYAMQKYSTTMLTLTFVLLGKTAADYLYLFMMQRIKFTPRFIMVSVVWISRPSD